MGIEIEGMKIIDEDQARALEAQGFISPDELKQSLQKLGTEGKSIDLNKLAIMHDRNQGVPLWKVILRELGFTKRE